VDLSGAERFFFGKNFTLGSIDALYLAGKGDSRIDVNVM
jgi:hypothetical protein